MATTYIKSIKKAKNLTAFQTMKERFEYGLNPLKCEEVSSYLCDPAASHGEFLLTQSKYQAVTDRKADRGALCYHIRQAFSEGSVTAEEANKLGYETAMRWTKGKHQFFVCTHTDKGHIHNHIYYCAVSEGYTCKFHNFIGSSFALRKLSDRVCMEYGLSVIMDPKQRSSGRYRNYADWLGSKSSKPQTFKERITGAIDAALAQKPSDFDMFLSLMADAGYSHKWGRGGVLSFFTDGQKRGTRLRASTLGDGYDILDIRAMIEGGTPRAAGIRTGGEKRVSLIVDIQKKLREGKGPAYERWAKVFNLKQMAAAMIYLRENGLSDYDDLEQKVEDAEHRYHALSEQIRIVETDMKLNAEIKIAIIDYAKTRPAFEEYKKAGYSTKYLAEHQADIAVHRAAKAAMKTLIQSGEKLPKMDALKAEWKMLSAEKKITVCQLQSRKKRYARSSLCQSKYRRFTQLSGRHKKQGNGAVAT